MYRVFNFISYLFCIFTVIFSALLEKKYLVYVYNNMKSQ